MSGYLNLDKNGLSIDDVISDLIKITNDLEEEKSETKNLYAFDIIKKLNEKTQYNEYKTNLDNKKTFLLNHINDILDKKITSETNIYSENEKKALKKIETNLLNILKTIQGIKDTSIMTDLKDFINYRFNIDENIKLDTNNNFNIKNNKNDNKLKLIKTLVTQIKKIFYDNFHEVINFGKKIGIWKNLNYQLSDLSIKTLDNSNDDKFKNYLSEIIFGLLLCKKIEDEKTMYNPIFTLLDSSDENGKINLDNLSEDEQKEIKIFVKNFLKYEKWLKIETDSKNQIINIQIADLEQKEELKAKCNLKYHNKSYKDYEMIESNLKNLSLYLGVEPNKFSHQKIYFGSPGTGKSYKLRQDVKKIYPEEIIRITFHPSYYYSDFVAVYKPIYNDGTQNTNFDIVYGPLIDILIKAFKNKDKNYLLIIDEINRANVSEVFGDFFQLIERNKKGRSEYEINVKKDLWDHLKKNELPSNNFRNLYFPSNLYIWATMNSSDQGTFPLDTAFKRRWDFEYIGIDDNEDKVQNINFKLPGDNKKIKWNKFRKLINKKLLEINSTINEDKLLGPFFIGGNLNNDDLQGNAEIIKNKVIPYLYEDVLKFLGIEEINKIFTSNEENENTTLTLSEIINKFKTKEIQKVFNFDEEEIKEIEEKE